MNLRRRIRGMMVSSKGTNVLYQKERTFGNRGTQKLPEKFWDK